MKKVDFISVVLLASCSQINDVANRVGGAVGNITSSETNAVGL
tara:strand:+ start:262 stop:390 length:129 start_codon:yes stop_codon:yes gene_type:complete